MQRLLAEFTSKEVISKLSKQPLHRTAFESRLLPFTFTSTNLRWSNSIPILTFNVAGISITVHLHWRLLSSNVNCMPILAIVDVPKQIRQSYFLLSLVTEDFWQLY